MATYTIIKLKNLSPLHIGTGKENYDFSAAELQSDTLSAALAAIRAQKGKTDDLAEFLDSFKLSSAFPFIDNHYFFPKPQGRLDIVLTDCDEYISRKKIKKIQFIEFELWQELIKGKRLSVQTKQLEDKFLLASIPNKGFEKLYVSQVNQRVSVPREEGKDAEPFFFDWKFFNPNSGLYCLLEAQDSSLKEIVELFKELGEVGIGTDKNIGGGKFDIETASIHLDVVSDANATMLLSLYIPTEGELSNLCLKDSHYELIQRGGFIAGSEETDFRHLRKKSICMFNVGTVFNSVQALSGKIVDLKPAWNDERMHPVYRSGKPIVVSIKTAKL